MGKLFEGQWLTDDQVREQEEREYQASKGRFQRGSSGFRNWITVNGEAGPSGVGGFKAEANRYHLFGAVNCPWAHRTMIYRNVKTLQDLIGLSLAAPLRSDQGWVFDQSSDRFTDELYGLGAVHELYTRADPTYSGRVTVPVLWDKKQKTIVSNESSEIIRMFNSAFDTITGDRQDFYRADKADEIDQLNDVIFNTINNGVYKTGFARTQEAYDESVSTLFDSLDAMEKRLVERRYLLGDHITEADWRFFPTLARFDVGYFSAFKCNVKAIRDYPNLSKYMKDLYQQPGVAETVDLDVYRRGYHSKNPLRNPHGVVPVGFDTHFTQ